MALINLNSGTKSKVSIPGQIERWLDHSKFSLYIRYIEPDDRIVDMVAECQQQGFHSVLAVGGDGTVNAVAACVRDSEMALGIVPVGSGNGLARHLQIPMSIKKSVEVINAQQITAVDYCTVNDVPFLCTFGIGFDAQVADRFAQDNRRGAVSYMKAAITEYLNFHHHEYHIAISGYEVVEKAFCIACANASQYGNNAYIAPKASMTDGLIDVTVIHPFQPYEAPKIGLKLFTKQIDNDINISTYRTSELVISRKSAGVIHIDGEPMTMPDKLHIKCHKAGIRIYIPDIENI